MPQPLSSPLRSTTPPDWVSQVMRDPISLLNDHAHLEKKAAGNALELLARCPAGVDAALRRHWSSTLTAVARDEAEHLATVTRILTQRGGQLSNSHRNPYAAALRKLVRIGQGRDELVDRLLVSALIELRSCERFVLLAAHGRDAALSRLYRALGQSEHGHYLVFVDLAERVGPKRPAEARWQHMLDAETEIMAAQPPGPRMHSGVL